MTCRVEYVSANHALLKSKVRGFGLERPRSSGEELSGESYNVSGWIMPYEGDCVRLIAKSNETEKVYDLNVLRNDVKARFELESKCSLDFCGFNFSVMLNRSFDVFVCVNDVPIKVWSFSVIAENYKFSSLWMGFHSSGVCDNSAYERAFCDESFEDDVSNIGIFNNFGREDFVRVGLDSCGKDFEALCEFLAVVKDPLWSVSSGSSLIIDDLWFAPSLSRAGDSFCVGSVSVDDYNFLLFMDSGFPFYVVQHISVVCIFFPTLGVVINCSVDQWCKDAVSKAPSLFCHLYEEYFSHGFTLDIPARFKGLVLSQSRPYHCFYDVMHGLYLMGGQGVDTKGPSMTVIIKRNMFFYDEGVVKVFLCRDDIEFSGYLDSSFSQRGCIFIYPGVQYSKLNDKNVLALMSDAISECASHFPGSAVFTPEKFELVLWIGVSAEKRCWVEQVDGWVNVLNKLSKVFSVCAVIDGRTSALEPSKGDRFHARKELEIFNEIKGRCPSVSLVSSIGLGAVEKIKIARSVSMFITSYATDSLYPSCICKKPGVVYAPKEIGGQRILHIHHDIVEVEEQHVKSCAKPSKVWHATSVSIDWNVIYHHICSRIESGLVNQKLTFD